MDSEKNLDIIRDPQEPILSISDTFRAIRALTKNVDIKTYPPHINFVTYPSLWQVWGWTPPPLPISEIYDVANSVCFLFWTKLKCVFYGAIFDQGWSEMFQLTDPRARRVRLFVRRLSEPGRHVWDEKTHFCWFSGYFCGRFQQFSCSLETVPNIWAVTPRTRTTE